MSSRSNQKSVGSVQIPNGKGTALHWSNGRGRPEAQVIKTEKKWKAGNLTHGEDLVVTRYRHRVDPPLMLHISGLFLSHATSH